MNCLIKFLSDSYQNRLRLLAQLKSERYEDTITNYKNIFISEFKNLKNKYCDSISCKYSSSCYLIKNTIFNIDIIEIDDYFDSLRNIYLLWIDAKSSDALQSFNRIIEHKILSDNAYNNADIDSIYFKGRISNDILNKWDMFHIPFNKRYLINNQRYSLTGQPIVYIGSSVIDIIEELDCKEISKLKVSSIELTSDLKLFDLRNNIFNELVNLDCVSFGIQDIHYGKGNFFKLILSSVCSFQKKSELIGFNFCEEYVLPQMLAQIIKNKKYDGIIYYSTKRFSNIDYEKNMELQDDLDRYLDFKENIALFTTLDTEHVYDKALYDKLKISVPIDVNKIERLNMDNLKDMQEKIKETRNQEKVAKADKIISTFLRIYGKIFINDISYIESDIGYLHIYHIFAFLNQLLVS